MNSETDSKTLPAGPGGSLKLLFFGHLPDLAGTGETAWPVIGGLTAEALLEQLYGRWPALRAHDTSLRVAVNLEYVSRDALIPPGAEVAIMPPVQGG
ncbi:MAG: MoaD/ThiS family protein [Verrucomicrobiota bacterium]